MLPFNNFRVAPVELFDSETGQSVGWTMAVYGISTYTGKESIVAGAYYTSTTPLGMGHSLGTRDLECDPTEDAALKRYSRSKLSTGGHYDQLEGLTKIRAK